MDDRRWKWVLLLAACLAPGCTSMNAVKNKVASWRPFTSAYDDPEADLKFARAQEHFQAGQYSKAHDLFKELADNTGNSATLAEQSRYMQAECARSRGHYPHAVDTYHRLLMDFPTGVHRQEACARIFEISDFWLDDFRKELERRQDEKGVLQWRPTWPNAFDKSRPFLVQESRALEALEYVHTHDFSGPLADKSLFWCGYVNFIRGNFDEADHFFSQLVELHKDSPLRPQALTFAIQAKNNATGGAIYDGRKCAEAMHLLNVAEASMPELASEPGMAERLQKSKFAIRYQQAEKDFKTAEYYERTGHPGSAVFYYELTRRRYAGTHYAEMASARKDFLKGEMDAGRMPTGNDPLNIAQAKFKDAFGKKDVVQADHEEPKGVPQGPSGPDPRTMPSLQPGPGGFPGQ